MHEWFLRLYQFKNYSSYNLKNASICENLNFMVTFVDIRFKKRNGSKIHRHTLPFRGGDNVDNLSIRQIFSEVGPTFWKNWLQRDLTH